MDSLCTTAANPGKDSVFPQHHPLPGCPEDISKTTCITRCHVWTCSSRAGGEDEGQRVVPAEQLCPTEQRTPRTDSSVTDAASPTCSVRRPRREEARRLSPVCCRKQHYYRNRMKHCCIQAAKRRIFEYQHFVFSVQHLCMPESDFNFIWRIMKYLSSLPNMSRSVAFSFERSAIFSALSRSLWKLLWIFLISSLLVEN